VKHHASPGTDLEVSSYCYGVIRFGTSVKGREMHEPYCSTGATLPTPQSVDRGDRRRRRRRWVWIASHTRPAYQYNSTRPCLVSLVQIDLPTEQGVHYPKSQTEEESPRRW
jgi:hypothetical protein